MESLQRRIIVKMIVLADQKLFGQLRYALPSVIKRNLTDASRNRYRETSAGLGAAVTLVTALFMPEELIVFGVLTLIGSSMLLVGAAKPLLTRIPAAAGLAVSLVLFLLTRDVNAHALGFYGVHIAALPDALYQNYLTAYFGFPHPGFYTTDYFSLLPWLFLFLAGFYVYQMAGQRILKISWPGLPPLNWIGRHALEIYVVHQPVIYGLLWLGSRVGGR